MRLLTLLTLLLPLADQVLGQVQVFEGPPPNTTRILDFDHPALAPGPTVGANPVFAAAGVSYIGVVGTWRDFGVTLPSVNPTDGNCLTANGSGLSIAGRAGRVERPTFGSGFEFSLSAPVDEFGFSQGQVQPWSYYRIELYSGPEFIGVKTATFGPQDVNPSGVAHVRAPVKFDRVRLTYTNFLGEVALNRIYLGAGSAAEPPLPDDCVETTFTGHVGGSAAKTIMFDVDASRPLEIRRLRSQFAGTKDQHVSVELYTVPGTHYAHITDPSAWTLASLDDGKTTAGGRLAPTLIELADPVMVPSGVTGIALVVRGGGHLCSYSDGFNEVQESGNGAFRVIMGTLQDGVLGGPSQSSRIWSGRLCASAADTGTNYCSPGVANSTGSPASLYGVGAASILDNSLQLVAENLPPGAFGIFLVSRLKGSVAGPGGSAGNLCLGGSIGRYVAPGQVLAAGDNGVLSLGVDLTSFPQPLGSVAGVSGDIWFFQAWYRDVVGGVAGSNFTNGLSVALE